MAQQKRWNEQMKRNKERFPADFMFQLTSEETERGGRRYRPYAFTEHGAIIPFKVQRDTRMLDETGTKFSVIAGLPLGAFGEGLSNRCSS
jgi:hypothetical protein